MWLGSSNWKDHDSVRPVLGVKRHDVLVEPLLVHLNAAHLLEIRIFRNILSSLPGLKSAMLPFDGYPAAGVALPSELRGCFCKRLAVESVLIGRLEVFVLGIELVAQ